MTPDPKIRVLYIDDDPVLARLAGKVLARNDLSHWAERFLRMLDHPPGTADTVPLARAAGRR